MFCRPLSWGLILALFACSSVTQAASPGLGSIVPYGAQRGGEIEINFNGGNLGDAQEIMLYYPGITVTHLEVVNENTIKTRLAIAPDCRLGIHAMRVRTATGITNLRTFNVGALPEVQEMEPNSEFGSPQKVALDTTVNGVADNEDVDYYVVEARKGERITAEIEGIRLGNTFFDPYVAILDKDRFELSACDDSALVWQDAVASIVAPEDGPYTIEARESAYAGNGSCTYRLHIGRFPRPMATIPAGGRPGETIQLTWLGDAKGPWTEAFVVPTEPQRMFGVFARDEFGIAPSPNVLRVSELGNVLELEPNDTPDTGTPAELPIALGGVIERPLDVDHFRFAAKAGQQFEVRVLGRGVRSPLDPVVAINRADGSGVTGNDDSGGPDAYVRFAAPADDTYVLSVRDHLGQGAPEYAYRVEIAPVVPTLGMGLPERQQYVDVTVPVPQGNRTAFLVSAGRGDFGGDVNVELRDLPAGTAFETVTIASNQSVVPVLLTAAPDAPLAGALVDVAGRWADPNQNVEGHLSQTIGLARGQNNILVWGHATDRMATAVTAEAPFKIEVIEPKVPLVRSGSMDLKVVCTRKEGFTAPIAVKLLYNPPGVSSSLDRSIPEGQTETIIPLSADGGAEIKVWKIVVMAEATVGNGSVLVSSQFANLDVAEPFMAFNFNAAAVEQGQETEVVIGITNSRAFEGNATVELLGLPAEVTSQPAEISKDLTELVFKVKTTANSPAGRHKTLLCRTVVTANGEPIVHTLGTGELRIDVPLPPKANEPPPEPTPMPVAVVEEKPPEKRLTRLEQLRLDREKAKAKKDAAGGEGGGEKPADPPG